ncbi:hypothetical protein EDC01DRAFT_717283 [Geopyxis carbonaria]|nr:hypothetical protein EDC01DRAFT_717283 [Geopyxis carbonaria]
MKASLAASTLLFLSGVLASAIPAAVSPSNIFKRAVTTDGTCGNQNSGANKGFTCPTSGETCCSQWGWCGSATEHCGTGCQSAFGTCSGSTTPPGTGVPVTTRPTPGPVPYGQWVSSCTRPGFIALTFDDGPHIYTAALLDLLKRNGVVATFFLNGQNWGAPITDPTKVALVKRMLAEGHQIASHTWNHPDLATLSAAEVRTQMTDLESALKGIIGKYPTYMRPPYFSCGDTCMSTLRSLGYHVIHSDLDTLDWQNNTPGTIQNSKNIFRNAINPSNPATNSFLPLLHDVHETTVNSLVQDMINAAKAKGYKFTTVGWCMSDNSANWYRTVQ